MKFLFSSLAVCPEVSWVHLLSEGHRPHWVFSLLRNARDAYLSATEFSDLEHLCARILRGYHYRPPAYPLKSHDAPPPPGSLPVLPADDSDPKMCVFSTTDCVRWCELTEEVASRVGTFRAPADWTQVDDAEEDRHVRAMLKSLDAICSMPLADPRMVTFIG